MDKRITCLLGAGATLEVGSPTTGKITEEVKKKIKQESYKREDDIFFLYKQLVETLKYNMGKKPDFEEIFHALEIIRDNKLSEIKATEKLPQLCKRHNSINYTIVRLRHKFKAWNYHDSNAVLGEIINTIGDLLNEFDVDFIKNEKDYQWFIDFWKQLIKQAPLDISTLNYDTTMESIISTFEDGYSEPLTVDPSVQRFHPEVLYQTNISRIMHLHGCINYGVAPVDYSHKYDYEDNFYDMFKYKSYSMANLNWNGYSLPESQSGETLFVGPIITGLRKTEKLLVNPYEFYHYEFQRAISHNNALLIVGYGAGDFYLNDILMRMAELHGEKRRIVWITYISKDDKRNWMRNKDAENPSKNEIDLVSNFMQDSSYIENLSRLGKFPECGYFVSKDDCMRVYFNGFQEAVKDDSLIKFLKS